MLEQTVAGLPEDRLPEARALLLRHFAEREPPPRRARIALIGLRGAGKSTLGPMLATALRVPFVELDREVEREARMDLSDIFEVHGQEGFRRLERSALWRLVFEGGPAVIAVGGGVVAEPVTFGLLLDACLTVWLRASPEEHMRRVVEQGDTRPMRGSSQAMDDLKAILASREALYAKADVTLDTSAKTPAQLLAELLALADIGEAAATASPADATPQAGDHPAVA